MKIKEKDENMTSEVEAIRQSILRSRGREQGRTRKLLLSSVLVFSVALMFSFFVGIGLNLSSKETAVWCVVVSVVFLSVCIFYPLVDGSRVIVMNGMVQHLKLFGRKVLDEQPIHELVGIRKIQSDWGRLELVFECGIISLSPVPYWEQNDTYKTIQQNSTKVL